MRVMDHLATLPWVDRSRIVITGHSRSGKAALWAGALDERFALVVPQGSGCGDMGSHRFRGPGSEGLADLTGNFPHWFVPGLRGFAGLEQHLPFDQHFVAALVAPRALLSIDALGDAWANPYGTGVTHLGARPVYELLGAARGPAISFREGPHELSDADWRTLLDHADLVFLGKGPARGDALDRLPVPVQEPVMTWTAPASAAPGERGGSRAGSLKKLDVPRRR
jgi:hypothetical protein